MSKNHGALKVYIRESPPVRKEVGVDFTRSRPFATWLATLSASFAGSLVANPLLGKPVILMMIWRMMVRMMVRRRMSFVSNILLFNVSSPSG